MYFYTSKAHGEMVKPLYCMSILQKIFLFLCRIQGQDWIAIVTCHLLWLDDEDSLLCVHGIFFTFFGPSSGCVLVCDGLEIFTLPLGVLASKCQL